MTRRTRTVRAVTPAVLLLLAALLLGPPSAQAADESLPSTWSVKPADNDHGNGRPNFAYGAEPGQVIADAIVLTNYSASPLTLQVYPADGFTTADGLIDLVPTAAESVDVGTWVRMEQSEVTLQPGARATVPFTLTVPAGARPGDHPGGIVTSLVTTAQDSTLSIDRRLASRINVRVPGELAVSAEVSDLRVSYSSPSNPLEPGAAEVSYRVTNTGNVRLYASEQISVGGPFGLVAADAALADTPEVLPGSTIVRTVSVDGVWPLLRARADLDLTPVGIGVSGTPSVISDRAGTWALSWAWAGVLAVLVVAAFLTARWRVRRGRAGSGNPDGTDRASKVSGEG